MGLQVRQKYNFKKYIFGKKKGFCFFSDLVSFFVADEMFYGSDFLLYCTYQSISCFFSVIIFVVLISSNFTSACESFVFRIIFLASFFYKSHIYSPVSEFSFA